MNLDVYHFSGKFHAVKMNQTVFRGGFIQLVWGDEKWLNTLRHPMPPSKSTFVENKKASKQNQ